MKYIVIGLGNYGGVLAEELTLIGHEVVGVDTDESKVDMVKDKIATSFVIDATDEHALAILPITSVDAVIVAVGENFGASIRIVALLKKSKVKRIYARAVDDIHHTVLDAFNLDKVLSPERDAARSFVRMLDLNVNVDSFKVDNDNYIMKFKLPKNLVGYKVSDLSLEKEFNLRIITLVKSSKTINRIGLSILDRKVDDNYTENYKIEENDMLVCYGKYKDFISFWKALS